MMFTIYFWRKLHVLAKIPTNILPRDDVADIDAGYCLDRYWLEKGE
jgi:hypothetical protein